MWSIIYFLFCLYHLTILTFAFCKIILTVNKYTYIRYANRGTVSGNIESRRSWVIHVWGNRGYVSGNMG